MYWLFWTPTGISPANRSRSGPKSVYMQLKSRQRSRNFGRDRLSGGGGEMEAQKCPRRRVFLSAIRDHISATSQRLIFAKFGRDTWIVVETQIFERNLGKVSIRRTKKVDRPRKLPGRWTTTRSKQFSRQCIPALSEVPVWPPPSLGFWGQMIPENFS